MKDIKKKLIALTIGTLAFGGGVATYANEISEYREITEIQKNYEEAQYEAIMPFIPLGQAPITRNNVPIFGGPGTGIRQGMLHIGDWVNIVGQNGGFFRVRVIRSVEGFTTAGEWYITVEAIMR